MTEGLIVDIDVARDFTRYPAGRMEADGSFSGEGFRKKLLVPPLKAGKRLRVLLDGAIGYGSSFLEEAFGGLTRREGFKANDMLDRIELVTDDSVLADEIRDYIREVPAHG